MVRRNLVDPASSQMLVSKIKPCMSQYKLLYADTANGSLKQLVLVTYITVFRICVLSAHTLSDSVLATAHITVFRALPAHTLSVSVVL